MKFKLLWAFCLLGPIDAIRALQLKPKLLVLFLPEISGQSPT
jgi:hypothetical protein